MPNSIIISGPGVNKTIKINDIGSFSEQINLPTNKYILTHGKEKIQIFIKMFWKNFQMQICLM